jgi:hypothetical protein
MGPSMQQFLLSSDVTATTCFGHTTIIKWHTVVTYYTLHIQLNQFNLQYVRTLIGF